LERHGIACLGLRINPSPHKIRISRPRTGVKRRLVQTREPVEDPRPVHAALGQQEMQVRVEVDPVPEGLDSNNDAGDELFAGQRAATLPTALKGKVDENPPQ